MKTGDSALTYLVYL